MLITKTLIIVIIEELVTKSKVTVTMMTYRRNSMKKKSKLELITK